MAAKNTPKHGGRRKGAGRKPADPSGKKKPCTVWLSPAEVAHCDLAGGPACFLRSLLTSDMSGTIKAAIPSPTQA